MTPRRWYDIWSTRTIDISHESLLASLLAADGMDTGFGSMPVPSWLTYCERIATTLAMDPSRHSLLEVGCGSGAFLYPFHQQGQRVSGIDQSHALIDIARQYLPNGHFERAFADDFKVAPADFVISMGVFMYFPDLSYASKVIANMARHAETAIAILDIPDMKKKEAAITYRQSGMTTEEYQRKYGGLDHLYYDKDWLTAQLSNAGFQRVWAEDQSIQGYANSAFRFNVFAENATRHGERCKGE